MAARPDPADIAPARVEAMGGLAKGLAIIELFGSGVPRLTVADAARGSDTSRAAARRCLLTLVDLGYLRLDGRYFEPLPRLHRLGGSAIDRTSLADHAQRFIAAARDTLDETVSLAVLDGRDAVFVARAEASRIVQTGVRLGARLPAHATSAGRLLLGALCDEDVRAYLATVDIAPRTTRSIVDRSRLGALIAEGRETGVSYNDEELELGMRAMAVAVRHHGEVIAAISVSTLTMRSTIADMESRYRPVLDQAATQLARSWARN